MPRGTLLDFSQLAQVFNLSGWMYFPYVQLHHAARAQFPTQPLIQLDPVEELLSQEGLQNNSLHCIGLCLLLSPQKLRDCWINGRWIFPPWIEKIRRTVLSIAETGNFLTE